MHCPGMLQLDAQDSLLHTAHTKSIAPSCHLALDEYHMGTHKLLGNMLTNYSCLTHWLYGCLID